MNFVINRMVDWLADTTLKGDVCFYFQVVESYGNWLCMLNIFLWTNEFIHSCVVQNTMVSSRPSQAGGTGARVAGA